MSPAPLPKATAAPRTPRLGVTAAPRHRPGTPRFQTRSHDTTAQGFRGCPSPAAKYLRQLRLQLLLGLQQRGSIQQLVQHRGVAEGLGHQRVQLPDVLRSRQT